MIHIPALPFTGREDIGNRVDLAVGLIDERVAFSHTHGRHDEMVAIRAGAGCERHFAVSFRDEGKVEFAGDQLRHGVDHRFQGVFLSCGPV